MSFSACASDLSLGPQVRGCRDDFDFTVKFEQLFFSILPASIYILVATWRIFLLRRRPIVIAGSRFQYAKLAAIVLYAVFELALLVLAGLYPFPASAAAIAASVLRLSAALCMILLSTLDHARSVRPSVVLSAYVFTTVVLDIAQARTLWLASITSSERAYASVFSTTLAVKVAVLFLEAQQKSRWAKEDMRDCSPEETSGMYSLGVFFWLNKLFLLGYGKILQIPDLYSLDRKLAADHAQEMLRPHLKIEEMRGQKYGLIRVLCRSLGTYLLLPIPFRLAMTAFTFCQPLFIEALLSHLSSPEDGNSKQQGYGLIGASGLVYFGISISTAFYWYFQFRMLAALRSCLVSSIYKHATAVRITTGDDGAALTLMSADIERITMGLRMLHELWACLIETGLASWLLYTKLGAAFVVPLVAVMICAGFMSILVRYTGPSQKAWMAGVQKRVGLTSTVIAAMKNLKISGLAVPIAEYVQKLRTDELASGSRYRSLGTASAILAYTPITVAPFLTFALAGGSYGPAQLFTSLAYITLLTQPFSVLFQFLPQIVSAAACMERIQTFLEKEEREDYRRFPALEYTSEKKGPEVVPTDEKAIPSTTAAADTAAIVVENASFGWDKDTMALKNISMRVPRSGLTMVVGPIASGKSTLCKALLGEMPFSTGGSVTFSSSAHGARTGFCEQTPFLSNATVRENIVGFAPFDAARYAEVVSATMLEVDLDTLPLRDETNVGSNGITLSGGQKQRVALARALYLHTDLLVLDDVFSGLDADTEDQVFQRVFAPAGMTGTEEEGKGSGGGGGLLARRGATVVLCTHSVRHLPFSQHVVALGADGTVVEQGSFAELDAAQGYVRSLQVKSASSLSSSSSAASLASSDITRPVTSPSAGATEAAAKGALLTKVKSTVSENDMEQKARQTGDKTVYKHYAASLGSIVSIAFIFFSIMFGGFSSFPPVWLSLWTQDSASAQPAHAMGYWVGLYALFQMLGLIALLGQCYAVFIVGVRRSGKYLHHEALHTLVHAPLRYFTTTDQGVTTNLFSQDLNIIDTQLPMSLMNFVATAFTAVGQAVVMCISSPYLAAGYPFLLALIYIVQKFYLRTSRQLRILDLEAKSPLYTHFLDTTKGLVTLRAHGQVQDDRAKNSNLLNTSQRPAYLLMMIQHWLELVLHLVVMGLALILVGLAVTVRSSAGFTGASLITIMMFSENLMVLVQFWTMFETSIGAIARLRAFATVKPEDRDGEDVRPDEAWPPRGAITLDNVSASYGTDSPDETPNLALREVTLEIKPGEKVAICGRTGSGKSSLIALLLKLLDPTPETNDGVRIDGVDVATLDRQVLRQCIISVPQDTVFLPDGTSFLDNIDPLGAGTAADAQSVLETVGLWTFVSEHGGLEAGMTAEAFSQGQRQLFSLARAVLRRRVRARRLGINDFSAKQTDGSLTSTDGGVLLLDEVSSSVDQDTEKTMQEIISHEFRSYTVVAVSHHLDMIMDFDRVVVMDRGLVAEVGRPRELVQTEGSRFGDLYALGGKV
ncbi:P-loop containing nucleoside triphosphate hydrolase protein [Microdochium trichocladiopsis]|uniref:P-loop containing nucleoside triphosphate hydrolase protein n=1 Tax=Microdochium trichocladiopsis TaxID=1682393 RepID=A0A9P9BW02_9PEZI|nr:P-loop containing nucleoside triphosphate hydrolase protein [Microdochium trichocladiopsis]KAH7040858.1 P-loop containing nucleoside triphosphate hydrolase protein [Microdochium trichocladiopsis]